MDFDDIFTAYYTQYRGDSTVPGSTEPEYTVGIRLANEAVNRWANYDNTFWQELETNLTDAADGTKTIVVDDPTYTAPTNMSAPAGPIRIQDSGGNTVRMYPLIQKEEIQFQSDSAHYAFFSGNRTAGYTLNLNPLPDSAINGFTIEYNYYKKPTEFATGTDTTEMKNPYFIVNHMLANRFRVSRNWSAYQTAKRDAEDALKIMAMENNSGSWGNPWKLRDRSGSSWGA